MKLSPARRAYAIGDIHGCAKTFRTLLFKTLRVQREDKIICIGDYIDRGPDSKGVIDQILELRKKGYDIIMLRGNHEQIMLDSGDSLEDYFLWLKNGGAETLDSFGAESYAQLATHYREFFERTLYWHAWEQYILVHAGLNFNIPDPLSDHHAMLWTRETEVDAGWLGERIVVHGHTPMPKDEILRQRGQNINIDGGCVYPYRLGMGWLTALELNSMTFYTVENVDM
jgi:serine/threonine protein phosphatase 1